MAGTKGDLNVDIGAELGKFEKALRGMQGDFKKAAGNIEQTSKTSSGTMQKAWTGSFKVIGGALAAAFGTQQIIQFAREATDLAAKAEGIKSAFDRLNSPNLLNNLRTATRGTVNDVELMRQAVRANNFQVPLEKLATFFEFATKRSAQTGESVDYLVNSIIDGIGRKSTLVLDNLGISAARLQDEVKKVGDFGLAAGNIIADELGKAGDVALTSAQKIAKQRAELENLKTEAGDALLPWRLELNELGLDFAKFFADLRKMGPEAALALRVSSRALKEKQEEIEKTNKKHKEFVNTLRQMTYQLEAAEKGADWMDDYWSKQSKGAEKTTISLEKATEAADKAQKAFERLRAEQMFGTGPIVGPDVNQLDIPDEAANMADAFAAQMDEIENLDQKAAQFFANLQSDFQSASMVAATFGQALNQAFTEGLQNGLNFGDALKRMFEDLATQMAAALLTAMALKTVLSALGYGGAISFGSLFLGQLGMGGMIDAQGASGISLTGMSRQQGSTILNTLNTTSQNSGRWNNNLGG